MTFVLPLGQNAAAVSTINVNALNALLNSTNQYRLICQVLAYLRFLELVDGKLDVLLPPNGSTGPNAGILDPFNVASTITNTSPYDVEEIGFTSISYRVQVMDIVGSYEMFDYSQQVLNSNVNPLSIQVAGKVRAIWAEFCRLIIAGTTGTAGENDGADALCGAGRGVSVAAALTNPLDDIVNLISNIWAEDMPARELVLMMNVEAWRKVQSLLLAAGIDPTYTPRAEMLNSPVLHLFGIPVAINAHIGTTDDLTTIYCFNRNSFVGLLHKDLKEHRVTKVLSATTEAHTYQVSHKLGIANLNPRGLGRLTSFDVTIA